MDTKKCNLCCVDKPLASYAKFLNGLQSVCRECQAVRWKAYKAEHGDKIRAKQREYHSKPEIRARKSASNTSEEGRAKTRAYMAEYRRKNRAKIYEYERKYADAIQANDGHFSAADRRLLFAKFDNKCLACGSSDRLVADHVIPVSAGGSNGLANRQLLCHSCNSKKKDGTTDFRNR